MNVLWVYAHPEARSLNGALRDEGLRTLTGLGHRHRESDLYAMGWNAVVDHADFGRDPDPRLIVGAESQRAYETGGLSEDIRLEHQKIDWADTIIFQFPLWWFGMPAILKGWFDRVFVKGFAYGVRGPDGRTARYGAGSLASKRAMIIVTAGGGEQAFSPRGINGDLDELLFPIQHGTFWYAGLTVLPPLAVFGADRVSKAEYETAAEELRERLRSLDGIAAVPYRHQNSDYDDDHVLLADHAIGRRGLSVHSVARD